MQSVLVVISWWSNCFGLECLDRLIKYTKNRRIFVIQVGKQSDQKELFRYYVSDKVIELPYSVHSAAEDWHVRERVVKGLLKEHEGVWFVDHDCLIMEDVETWLNDMDHRFDHSDVCLCHPIKNNMESITNPLIWISPVRLPVNTPSFAPDPISISSISGRPFESAATGMVTRPNKDTLVKAMEYLKKQGKVDTFPVDGSDQKSDQPTSFPFHDHLGGLSILTLDDIPDKIKKYAVERLMQFNQFYARCAPEYRSIEDPVLKNRLKKYSEKYKLNCIF